MRSRRALTAALALSVVTILAVAACGSYVQGSAQVNTAMTHCDTSPLPRDFVRCNQVVGQRSIGDLKLLRRCYHFSIIK